MADSKSLGCERQSGGKPCVLLVAGDAGGAAAWVPVVKLASQKGYTWHLRGYAQAVDIWRKAGLAFLPLDRDTVESDFDRILQETEAGVVALGTSVNPFMMEIKALRAARRRNIPSIALLDFWTNCSARFPQGLDSVPDIVAVMDEAARDELLAINVPLDRIQITGQPAFSEALVSRISSVERQAIRERFGVTSSECWVVFFSQPIDRFYAEDLGKKHGPGFTEHKAFNTLIRGLIAIGSERGQPFALSVRRHPRETTDWNRTSLPKPLRFVPDIPDVMSRLLAQAADLVVGMNSAILVEACYMGCMTISLQPGLQGTDALPSNRFGWSLPVYDTKDIDQVLATALFNASFREEHRRRLSSIVHPVDAVQRVMNLIERLFCGSRPKVQK